MIPEIAMFWVISTALVPRELPSRRGDQQKNPLTRIFNFMRVGKKPVQFEISSAEISPRVCTAKNCVLVFKEMDHCYVVCVVLQI
jgi:hypothetical protein